MASMTPLWNETRYTLSYRIGELTLFRRGFSALTLANHFLELSTAPDELALPEALPRGNVDAAIILSHPVHGTLPRVCTEGPFLRYVPNQ